MKTSALKTKIIHSLLGMMIELKMKVMKRDHLRCTIATMEAEVDKCFVSLKFVKEQRRLISARHVSSVHRRSNSIRSCGDYRPPLLGSSILHPLFLLNKVKYTDIETSSVVSWQCCVHGVGRHAALWMRSSRYARFRAVDRG